MFNECIMIKVIIIIVQALLCDAIFIMCHEWLETSDVHTNLSQGSIEPEDASNDLFRASSNLQNLLAGFPSSKWTYPTHAHLKLLHKHSHTHARDRTYTYMHTHTHTQTHIYTHIYTQKHNTHTHTHKLTHKHIHTQCVYFFPALISCLVA